MTDGPHLLSIIGLDLTTVVEAISQEEVEQESFEKIDALEEEREISLKRTKRAKEKGVGQENKKGGSDDGDLTLVYESGHHGLTLEDFEVALL